MTDTTTPILSATLLRAVGFTNPSCIATIEDALRALPGVESVVVRFISQRIEVVHDAERTSVRDLVDAVTDLGFPNLPALL